MSFLGAASEGAAESKPPPDYLQVFLWLRVGAPRERRPGPTPASASAPPPAPLQPVGQTQVTARRQS
jgi:hypothetical protein